jgi:hypothetical protein
MRIHSSIIVQEPNLHITHQDHLRELQEIIFKKFDIPYSVVIYGDPSPELLENAKAGGMDVKIFTLLQGL